MTQFSGGASGDEAVLPRHRSDVVAGHPLDAALAERVQLVVFDVDGVLTDAGVYLSIDKDDRPVEFKRFDIQDGLGIKMLEWSGLPVAIVSGRVSPATTIRARELGVTRLHQDDGAQKVDAIGSMIDELGIGWEAVALLGDDLPDLAALRRVGLPAAVASAVPEVKAIARWIGTRSGGRGAAREFAEALLRARRQWDGLVEQYVRERGGPATSDAP